MSHAAQTWAVQQRTGSPARKAVLMNLADRADEAWSCFPGQRRIADDTELGERTVRRALDDLETAGLILRFHRRRKDGSWTSDRYVLAGYTTDPDAVRLLADSAASGQSGRRADSHSAPPLADADTSGHSGRRPERPSAGAAADPAAAVAGHEPSGSNHHSTTPPPSEGPPAADAAQLSLVDAPAEPDQKPGRRKTLLPEDWEPSPELAAWTREFAPGFPRSELDQFRDWAKSDRVLKADWDATWRNSVRRWKERTSRTRGPGRPGPYRDTGWQDGTSAASWDRLKETGGQDR